MNRLWREEGLQRPTPRKQQGRLMSVQLALGGSADARFARRAMIFQFEATGGGRRLKFLNVIDEHSRLCLAIRVGTRCKAEDVVAVLEDLTSLYPAPAFICS